MTKYLCDNLYNLAFLLFFEKEIKQLDDNKYNYFSSLKCDIFLLYFYEGVVYHFPLPQPVQIDPSIKIATDTAVANGTCARAHATA